MTSRADQHDIDKLVRWRRDLTTDAGSVFPVYAIFLVSPDDRAAHNVFRQFRGSFEARNAGFENLVIFGQHGISSTVRGLLPELGLPPEAIPTLALLVRSEAASVYSLPLPPGDNKPRDAAQQDLPWQVLLARVEEAADEGNESVDLGAIDGLSTRQMAGGPLVQLIDRLLASLG